MADEDECYDSLSELRGNDKGRPIWFQGQSQQSPPLKHDNSPSRQNAMSRTYGG
eukprot:CAMPEP_0113711404 /NCGR_PEP_ID=MMETSP0038_2-20120614/30734_1 /TAXON_ID=2898 /ORGANISM="Cryptomonas paramecium" /LENGTH=53 /DNA_ID=CAMNT_0000637649 /DNA_START=268 /DNA_END=426 /DNA_ORIENTATION=- /assembly_acc=CAM_ASM_000170